MQREVVDKKGLERLIDNGLGDTVASLGRRWKGLEK